MDAEGDLQAAAAGSVGRPAQFSREDHRRRLLNIQAAERSVRACLKRQRITNYLPGHASYNIGEYPSRVPYDPDGYDEEELERLHASGVEIIQIMEDWNDLLRLHGADRFSSPNPQGLARFIEMAHQVGIKVLLYASSGYMQDGDPDLEPEWTRESFRERGHSAHWKLLRCSPASAGWRSYVLPKTMQVMEDYEADGLYNDWGYVSLHDRGLDPTDDEVLAWEETSEHDAAKEDLLALIYSEVKRRGLIYKVHADFNGRPKTAETLYDYLWVGEGIGDLAKTRDETKLHPPYVIPSFDQRLGGMKNEDQQYLNTIPYLQFPQLLAGRPFTGERAVIPGVDYRTEEDDLLLRQWRSQWRYYQDHPDGPHIYGPWDISPARPLIRETYAKWLSLYRPMVQEGAYAYLEISDSDLFVQPPERLGVVASMFVNLDTYLVLANYNEAGAQVETSQVYTAVSEVGEPRGTRWVVPGESMLILRKVT